MEKIVKFNNDVNITINEEEGRITNMKIKDNNYSFNGDEYNDYLKMAMKYNLFDLVNYLCDNFSIYFKDGSENIIIESAIMSGNISMFNKVGRDYNSYACNIKKCIVHVVEKNDINMLIFRKHINGTYWSKHNIYFILLWVLIELTIRGNLNVLNFMQHNFKIDDLLRELYLNIPSLVQDKVFRNWIISNDCIIQNIL